MPLDKHLARCAAAGVDMIRLQLRGRADGSVDACATESACAALSLVLSAKPSPALLLDTPVELLDAVQSAVTATGSASRVRVAPQVERPGAAQAPRVMAPGVTYWAERRNHPRPMMVHVLEIDFRQAGALEFVTTPTLPAPAGATAPVGTGYFTVQKTTDYAQRNGLLAAINASYFLPFDGGRLLSVPYIPQAGSPATVAPAQWQAERPLDDPASDPRADAMVCVQARRFSLHRSACPAGSLSGFPAGPMLIEQGQRRPLLAREPRQQPDATGVARYFREAAPRTAMGLDPAGQRAWLVVVDGRQGGYSEGITLPELVRMFEALGATDAINLDGGGSSTLVLSGQIANSPIHTAIPGRERPVANHFGLRLQPSQTLPLKTP